MNIMKRNVFFTCLIAIIIFATVVPVNQILAYEPANLAKNKTSTIIRPENGVGFSDFAVSPDGRRLIYALYGYDFNKTVPEVLSLGIYTAELSQPIPEFPIMAMLTLSISVILLLLFYRTKIGVIHA